MPENNTPILLKRRARKAVGVKFDGTNGKQIVEWFRQLVQDHPEGRFTARNGGRYIKFQFENHLVSLRAGQWLVVDADDTFKVYDDEVFRELFLEGTPL